MTIQIGEEKDKTTFETLDFFMLRSPLFPIDLYKKIFCNGKPREDNINLIIEEIKNNDVMREAILAASLSLYNELVKIDEERSARKKKQIISSLVKYITRMSTRTTPYGLFSGVTRGSFGEKTEVKFKPNTEYIKRARVDMEWLYGVIKEIENNERILDHLLVVRNDLIYENGTRLDVSYISNYGQLMKEESLDNISCSIRNSNQVQTVMDLTKTPIKYHHLISKLNEHYEGVDISVIKRFIQQLLSNEYLITEMRPPLVNTDPLTYVISKVNVNKEGSEVFNQLLEIRNLIEEYNKIDLGKGEKFYLDIIDKMNQIYKCKNYLQVDMALVTEIVELDRTLTEDVKKVAELALKLSVDTNNSSLDEYLNEFLEVYGDYREVPLLELLDEDKGLGAPAGYTKPQSQRSMIQARESKDTKNFSSYLMNKIIVSLLNNKKEVVIEDDEISKMNLKINNEEVPTSFEIYFILSQSKPSNEVRFHLGPNPGSNSGGKTFGRFVDIMPQQVKNDLTNLENQQLKQWEENIIMAELVELPQSGRLSNISLNWSPCEYELVIATNNSNTKQKLRIDDIFIGIERSGEKRNFYLKSKIHNKKVVFKTNNMLNPLLSSNLYRFMLEVSSMKNRNIMYGLSKIYESLFSDLKYIPRIVYRNTVLYPENWKLSNGILNLENTKYSIEEFYQAIELWKTEWNVPKFVYLKENDNRLLLNLENLLHVNELYNVLVRGKKDQLILTETEGVLDGCIATNNQSKYCTEIVVPLIKGRETTKNSEIKTVIHNNSTFIDKKRKLTSFDDKRTFFPGDEWVSMKLYGNSKRTDEIIAFYIRPFCEELIKAKYISKYFFLRYADPQKHIRLRLKIAKNIPHQNLMENLNQWFKNLCNDGLLSNVLIDTYKREVERYGGIELIDLAEDIFFSDSIIASNILNLKRSNQLDISLELIVVANIINMMEELNMTFNTQKELFTSIIDKTNHRHLFEKNRKNLLNICNSFDHWKGLKAINSGKAIHDLLQYRKKSLNIFASRLNELDLEENLWNDKKSIILSLIHMHCNRILESRQKENEVMATVRHTLYSLEYIKKKQEGYSNE